MPVNSGIVWRITVLEAARIVFTGTTKQREELEAVAAEARRMRPRSRIIINPPMGQPSYDWEAHQQ